MPSQADLEAIQDCENFLADRSVFSPVVFTVRHQIGYCIDYGEGINDCQVCPMFSADIRDACPRVCLYAPHSGWFFTGFSGLAKKCRSDERSTLNPHTAVITVRTHSETAQ